MRGEVSRAGGFQLLAFMENFYVLSFIIRGKEGRAR